MSKLFVSEHPLIHTKMAMLRDEQTGTKEFRVRKSLLPTTMRLVGKT